MNESMSSSKLGEFFINSLHEMYWGEFHLVEILTTMTDVSTSEELRDAFETHREQTRQHVERLNNVFEMLGLVQDTNKPITYRTDAAGFPFLRYLSAIYYHNDIFPDEWRQFILPDTTRQK